MYSLMHKLRAEVALPEAVALVIALVIAEIFYQFHSFTLECVAFLATWYALGGAAALLRARFATYRDQSHY